MRRILKNVWDLICLASILAALVQFVRAMGDLGKEIVSFQKDRKADRASRIQ